MSNPADQSDERKRLAALWRYGVLDTASETSFDQVTSLAAHICETPISLVTLVDENRQWFKSRFGWEQTESSRAISFCAHAIQQSDMFIIEDASADDRFNSNPFVTGEPGIRFYAGAPLIDAAGYALGTLCVIDSKPGKLKEDHAQALRLLRDHVMTLLEIRRHNPDLDFSESIIDSLPGVFYLIDQSGRFLHWNPRAEKVTGYSREAFSGLDPLDLFTADNQRLITEHTRKVFEFGRSEVTASMITGDGTEVPYYFTGERLVLDGRPCLTGMGADISRLYETEEALRESESRYRTLVESARDAIVTVSMDGVITSVNPAFRKISRWEPETWLGHNFAGLLHPNDIGGASEGLTQLARGEQVPPFELRVKTKDGEYVPVEVTASLFEQAGKEQAVIVVARDIRERWAMDQQLRRMQKLDAIGQLAAGVAHDFNNLLTVILGEAELLQTEKGLPESVIESVKQITETAERGQQITRELLLLSRDQPFRPAPLDLHGLVTRFTPMLERLLRDKHAVELRLAPDLPLVSGDQGMLEQVLMNLVINARDAMPDGGPITITTEQIALDEIAAARHPDATAGSYVSLCVIDTGVGIDPEQLSQIFEPLFTTKSAGEGTGLGLAIILGIVRRHKGWVEVSSEVGQGTTFHVYLPLAPQS